MPDWLAVLLAIGGGLLVLRHAIRTAGREPIERHWPGSADGLGSLLALLGLRSRR